VLRDGVTTERGMRAPLLFAYFMPPNAIALASYFDVWVSPQASNGFCAVPVAY
jgi:hypothetical protein